MVLELNDILIGIVMIVFGVLFIFLPYLLNYLVGIGFIIVGVLKFVPSKEK
jgi:uncharacterized membrane protein HdeD (DUF308 family)